MLCSRETEQSVSAIRNKQEGLIIQEGDTAELWDDNQAERYVITVFHLIIFFIHLSIDFRSCNIHSTGSLQCIHLYIA